MHQTVSLPHDIQDEVSDSVREGVLNVKNGNNDNSLVTTIVLVVGTVLTFLAVALTSYYTKKELNKVSYRQSPSSRRFGQCNQGGEQGCN
jgi:hypothetical protein